MQVVLVMAQSPVTAQVKKAHPVSEETSGNIISAVNNYMEYQVQQLWGLMFSGFSHPRILAREPQQPKGKYAAVTENSHQER